jgi:predicted enzyme related to lactoylglutathione lyase
VADAVGTVGSVVLNVTDLDKEKAFWMAFLGVGVAREFPGFCWLEPQHPGGVSVALQTSGDPGDLAGRVHLDTGVADVEAARTAVEALGGSHLEDHEIMGFRWAIMADPEGNRFCIAAEG